MATSPTVRRHAVNVVGSGERTLVLAHGMGCDQTVWRRIVPMLADDFRLVLFDYVGSGRSDRSAYDASKYGSLQGYANDLTEIVCAVGGERPVLVAHSVSSSIGLLAAAANPTLFDRLVLVSPNPRFTDDPPWVGGLAESDIDDFLALMDQNFLGWAQTFSALVESDVELRRELTGSFCSTDPRAIRQFAEITLRSDVRDVLGEVDPPALILQCSNDPIAPRSVGEHLLRALRGSQLEIVDIVGHCPHLSRPREVVDAVRRFAAP